MYCPRCKNTRSIKAGFPKGRQRYLCRPCKYYYTVTQRSNAKSSEVRRLAFEMYLEGMGFRAIKTTNGYGLLLIYLESVLPLLSVETGLVRQY